MKDRKQVSIPKLFSIFFRIGAFTFGGGYAMLPIVQHELVDKLGWLEDEDFLDMIGLAQSAPGPVVINSSIYLGYRLQGLGGAVGSVTGVVLPSLLVIMAVAWALTRYNLDLLNHAFAGVRPTVVSLIAYAAWKLGKAGLKSRLKIALAVLATFLIIAFNVHPVLLIVSGALLGVILDYSAKKESAQS